MWLPIIFLMIIIFWACWLLSRPAKRVIVQPVKMDGAISQQTFLVEKKTWEVLWGSDLVNLIRVILDLIGLLMVAGWLWG